MAPPDDSVFDRAIKCVRRSAGLASARLPAGLRPGLRGFAARGLGESGLGTSGGPPASSSWGQITSKRLPRLDIVSDTL